MTADKEKSFKAILRNIAKETNKNTANLWQSLVLERFLVRLEQSDYRHCFILKGGVLLAKYIPIGRETQDLDFLGVGISNDKNHLKTAFSDIANINHNDGFIFKDIDVTNLAHSHMSYAGVEVSMMAFFGRTRFPVQIDVGFGDTLPPIDKQIELIQSSKGPLFEKEINLLCYPPEFIFAEKLETIVYRKGMNSRMKDFHDLYNMLKIPDLSYEAVRTAIFTVFKHRNTNCELPLKFSDSDISILQLQWLSYRARLLQNDAKVLPIYISECISFLNEKLIPILGSS
jgi:predicted nucleotidyltransferase component of viral defense system